MRSLNDEVRSASATPLASAWVRACSTRRLTREQCLDFLSKGLSPSMVLAPGRYDEEGDIFTLGLARESTVLSLVLSMGAYAEGEASGVAGALLSKLAEEGGAPASEFSPDGLMGRFLQGYRLHGYAACSSSRDLVKVFDAFAEHGHRLPTAEQLVVVLEYGVVWPSLEIVGELAERIEGMGIAWMMMATKSLRSAPQALECFPKPLVDIFSKVDPSSSVNTAHAWRSLIRQLQDSGKVDWARDVFKHMQPSMLEVFASVDVPWVENSRLGGGQKALNEATACARALAQSELIERSSSAKSGCAQSPRASRL